MMGRVFSLAFGGFIFYRVFDLVTTLPRCVTHWDYVPSLTFVYENHKVFYVRSNPPNKGT